MNRFTNSLMQGLALFVLLGLTAGTANAQDFFASANGSGVACTQAAPCDLEEAVAQARVAAAPTANVWVGVAEDGGSTEIEADLVGASRVGGGGSITIEFGAWNLSNDAFPVNGTLFLDGDVVVGTDDVLAIEELFEFSLVDEQIELRDGAEVAGDGTFSFTANQGEQFIFLGRADNCPAVAAAVATISAPTVLDKAGGEVKVVDCSDNDSFTSELHIENSFDLVAGQLILNENDLHADVDATSFADPSDGFWNLADGTAILGDSEFFVNPLNYDNDRDGAWYIEGPGFISVDIVAETDAGVVLEAEEVGRGGDVRNRAGFLAFTDATMVNGTFDHEGDLFPARTEFDALNTITSNLEVNNGTGGQLTGQADGNTTCEGIANEDDDDDETGVFFLATAVTVEGQFITNDTDSPGTDCVEGVFFAAGDAAAAANVYSLIEGDYTSDGDVGITLGADDFFHNVEFRGDFNFDESPIFTLEDAADAFYTAAGVPEPFPAICDGETKSTLGNKVRFGGSASQNLEYNSELRIESVEILKSSSGDLVEIDESSDVFLIDTTLEVLRGIFITNGLLDVNAGGGAGTGGTVVINRDDNGFGILERGDADRAYIDDDASNTPRKLKYQGSVDNFTADEVPGPSTGSDGIPGDVTIEFFEVCFCTADETPTDDEIPVLTIGKPFTVLDELILTTGLLDVGSTDLTLANEVLIAIGNGGITREGNPPFQGDLIFPNEDTDSPFTLGAAFDASIDGIDLLYFGTTDRTVSLAWPSEQSDGFEDPADPLEVIRDVEINLDNGAADADGPTVALRADEHFRVNGDLDINAGRLDINGTTFDINATNGVDTDVYVDRDGNLIDSTDELIDTTERVREVAAQLREARMQARAGEQVRLEAELYAALQAREIAVANKAHAGLLKFIGGNDTDVFIDTHAGRLRFNFPAIEVDKDGTDPNLTFDANGVLSTTVEPIAPNRIDILGTSHFTLTDADGNGNNVDGDGGVLLDDGIDLFDIADFYIQNDGEFLMSGVSSIGPAPTQAVIQEVSVGGNMWMNEGEFFSEGGDVTVFGNYTQGPDDGTTEGSALFSLASEGIHTVVGDFTVGPDEVPASDPSDLLSPEDADEGDRNRYYLGNGDLFLFGDYSLQGSGDNWDDDVFLFQDQGLDGTVWFLGDSQQSINHRQDEDAFFNDVAFSGEGGGLLETDAWQNFTGTLLLELGVVDTNDETFDWIILNPGFEPDLIGRNNSARGVGVVQLGSRDSYVDGAVQRVVEFGNATGGVISGGYLFPVGAEGDDREGDENEVDFFRPLILQFPDDLGRSSTARVDYLEVLDETGGNVVIEDLDFDPFTEFESFDVDALGGGSLNLNVLSDMFWLLQFDRIPSFDPNIRVEAPGLPNIFDIKSLRLVQWDCDGNFLGLAGVYDIDVDPNDDPSAVQNDFINGVPNLTQEGVEVRQCNIIGIASDAGINAIDQEDGADFGFVQHINVSGEEVTVAGRTLQDGEATPFLLTPEGTDIGDGVTVAEDGVYVMIHADGEIIVKSDARMTARSTNFEFFGAHAAANAPEVDIVTLDPFNGNAVNGLLANNIEFGDVTNYTSVAPNSYNVAVTTADGSAVVEARRFDLGGFGGDAAALVAWGDLGTDFQFCFFLADGSSECGDVVTDTDPETELPAEFALDGNYPNPFNPSTTIQFDLPATAEVTVEIVDLLGRNVMTLPVQQMAAGSNRTLQVDATSLASGTYLYRVIARTATDTMVKTGRMTLIK